MTRTNLLSRTRFETLKRDDFACQYCGRNVQDGVKLHVDHIVAVANGGTNDAANLVTACQDCNLGKAATPLDVVSCRECARHIHGAIEGLCETCWVLRELEVLILEPATCGGVL